MAVWEVHVCGTAVEDRQVQRLSKADQVWHSGRVFANHTRDRDRIAGLGQHTCRALNRLRCGHTARWRHARVGSVGEAGALLGNDLARQSKIDGPLRLTVSESEGTVN